MRNRGRDSRHDYTGNAREKDVETRKPYITIVKCYFMESISFYNLKIDVYNLKVDIHNLKVDIRNLKVHIRNLKVHICYLN